MARVVFTPLQLGVTSAAATNTIFTAIASQTANVNAQNFAEEGLDERVLEAEIQTERAFAPINHTTKATQALTGSFATLDPGAALPFVTGGFSLGTNEVLRVRHRMDFPSDAVTHGIPINQGIEVRLVYNVGAGNVVFASSVRNVETPVNLPGIVGGGGMPARLSSMFRLVGPLTFTSVTVQIRAVSGTPTVQVGRASLTGTIFKRHF